MPVFPEGNVSAWKEVVWFVIVWLLRYLGEIFGKYMSTMSTTHNTIQTITDHEMNQWILNRIQVYIIQ